MKAAVAEVHLRMEGIGSLKDKRRIIRSLIDKLRNRTGFSVAEVGDHDLWGNAVIGLVTVGTDPVHLRAAIESAVEWLENEASVDVQMAEVEVLGFP